MEKRDNYNMTTPSITVTPHSSGPGITGITVVPTHTGPGPSGNGTATAVPVGNGAATLTPVFTPAPPPGKVGLMSVSGGTTYTIEYKNVKDHKKKDVEARTQAIFDLVHNHAEALEAKAGHPAGCVTDVAIETRPNPDATNFEKSNVAREIVVITYTDGVGVKHTVTQRAIPTEILDKMHTLRHMIRPHLNFGAQAPLLISNTDYLPPKDLNEYLEKDFPALEASLTGPAKSNALQNVLATEAMIQGFKLHLQATIDDKEAELKDPKLTTTLPYPDRENKEAELRKLKKMLQQLESIDRRATFRAVATWNNLATGPITDAVKRDLHTAADTVTVSGEKTFQDREKARQDSHYFSDSYLGRKVGAFVPLDPKESRAYNLDNGDILLPDRLAAHERRVNTQRTDTRSCMEQMVFQIMMDLNSPAPGTPLDIHPALEDLSDATRGKIIGTIQAPLPPPTPGTPLQYFPKAYARTVHAQLSSADQILTTPGADLQRRLAAAKATNNPQARYDTLIKTK